MSAPGEKFDQHKSRVDLIPGSALIEVGTVLAFGAAKYAENGWQLVPGARARYLAALLRHVCAMQEGEVRDPESGLLHAAHAATNALFLLWFAARPEVAP